MITGEIKTFTEDPPGYPWLNEEFGITWGKWSAEEELGEIIEARIDNPETILRDRVLKHRKQREKKK